MVETRLRLPDYLKRPIAPVDSKENKEVRQILRKYGLNTVCDGARCPNKSDCYGCLTATFLIMGKVCTRNCRYCNIACEKPLPPDENEPENLAAAAFEMGLKYVVVTSVTRDDLKDGGAAHFSRTIEEIKKKDNNIKVEILTPDFKGEKSALDKVIEAKPDVFNHNVETTPALYKTARPQADYERSLGVLSYVKEKAPDLITKTGIMIGLGETEDEIIQTMKDIKGRNTDILTIGQYISPSKAHLPVKKYYTIEEYKKFEKIALEIGFSACVSAPLARSSYRASETFELVRKIKSRG